MYLSPNLSANLMSIIETSPPVSSNDGTRCPFMPTSAINYSRPNLISGCLVKSAFQYLGFSLLEYSLVGGRLVSAGTSIRRIIYSAYSALPTTCAIAEANCLQYSFTKLLPSCFYFLWADSTGSLSGNVSFYR